MAAVNDTEAVDGPYYLEKVSIPDDSEDGFQYEEISVEEESVTEEEDLDTAAKVLRKLTSECEFPPEHIFPPSQKVHSHVPEVVDDFLRNFLVKMGMNKTLNCFQREWFEKLHKGTFKTNQVGLVPDIYTHNQLLENNLKNVQRERDSYKQAAFQAGDTIVRLQKERDLHRMQHNRVVQEKNRLIEEIQRLKKHYESYPSALKQLNEKYQTALRQKMLVRIDRDKLSSQVPNIDSNSWRAMPGTRRFSSPERRAKPSVDKRTTTSKHSKDSRFPTSARKNPFLPKIKAQSAQRTELSKFSLTKSFKAHTLPVNHLTLHPDKLLVASASEDHLWRLWEMPEGELIMTGEGHTGWVSSCSFHPSGQCLATTSEDTTLKIWDFEKSCCVLTLEGHTHITWGCSFHSCGDFVATCSMDNTAKVWDLNSERCRYTLRGHADSVNSISFLPFSNILLTCSADKSISLWDTRAKLCTRTFYGHRFPCNSATFNALGDTIASCDSFGVVKVWDLRSMSTLITVDTGPHASNQVVFSPNGHVLAVASDDYEVKLVEVASSRVSRILQHKNSIQSVVFDHKGENLFSSGYNGDIFVWS